ncbi:hypothetical protein V2G26_011583 [Clonostachys chloroleuca]
MYPALVVDRNRLKQPFRTFAHVGQKSIPSTADWIHVVALASWHLRSTAPLGLPYGLNARTSSREPRETSDKSRHGNGLAKS